MCAITKLGGVFWVALVPVGVLVSRVGAQEGNGTCQPFCSWRSHPKIPIPPA